MVPGRHWSACNYCNVMCNATFKDFFFTSQKMSHFIRQKNILKLSLNWLANMNLFVGWWTFRGVNSSETLFSGLAGLVWHYASFAFASNWDIRTFIICNAQAIFLFFLDNQTPSLLGQLKPTTNKVQHPFFTWAVYWPICHLVARTMWCAFQECSKIPDRNPLRTARVTRALLVLTWSAPWYSLTVFPSVLFRALIALVTLAFSLFFCGSGVCMKQTTKQYKWGQQREILFKHGYNTVMDSCQYDNENNEKNFAEVHRALEL